MRPTECKFCGLHGVWHIDDDTVFACGTIWAGRVDVWNQSTGCVEIMANRDRIRRALNVLKAVDRYDTDNVDPDTWCGDEFDQAVDADVVDQVIQILEGESDGQTD